MTTFAFSATLTGLQLDDDDQVDRLFSEDFVIVPSERDGVTSVAVEIDEASGECAIQTLIKHITTVPGVTLTRIDPDLVNQAEIAERLGVTREAVRTWATGTRGPGDFPKHMTVIGRQRIWAWSDVFAWAEIHQRLDADEPRPLDAACVDWFNGTVVPHATRPGVSAIYLEQIGIVPGAAARHWSARTLTSIPGDVREESFLARDGSGWQRVGSTIERITVPPWTR